MKPEDAKIGVWYLVITVYGWDQTSGDPEATIIRRGRRPADGSVDPDKVARIMRAEGYESAPGHAQGPGTWTYRCKAYWAKRVDQRSPLGRLGSTMWPYAARRLP